MSKNSPYTKTLIESKFWQHKSLQEMQKDEWEAICDGCARCCLHKFIDDDSVDDVDADFVIADQVKPNEEVLYTNIACYLLNDKTCACSQYDKRLDLVPDCVGLNKDNIKSLFFLPPSCSYRRIYEGKGLAHWHPLLNKGKKSKMHALGVSVRNRTIKEADVDFDRLEDFIVTWPTDTFDSKG